MSAAALAMLSPESKSAVKSSSKTLRVNEPGDVYEREADKVANTVASGGRISNWSLSASGAGLIQRDSNTAAALPPQSAIRKIGDPQDPPPNNNYDDMLGKLAEAFLKTDAGKTIVRYLEDQPIVKDAKDFVQTPTGIVVAGSTAIAAISGLAAAGKRLPAQLPSIPLDKLHPGLSVKVNVEGPLNHPTQGSLMVSFGAVSPKKKSETSESDKYRAETRRMAEQMKFGAGVDPGSLGPGAPTSVEKQADDKRAQNYAVSRMSAILQPNAPHAPGTFTPLVPGTQPKSLHMRDDIAPETPHATTKDESKKEEIPVQRKAESILDYQQDAASDVDSVLNSSGQPLDRETRRTMESRIGFDFSKVRIHADTRAGASARSLGARAYTVGNNVVFAPGRFAPQTTEGRRLLAHELTHVVQQSPNRAAMPPAIRPAPVHVQRDADEDAKKFSLIKFARDRRGALGDVADGIPGYTLFTVIINYDPIRGKHVDRNATNLIGGFLKLINKEAVFKDLQESHALEDAFAWLDREVNTLQFSVAMFEDLINKALDAAWNASGGIAARLRSAYAVFQPALDRAITFAGNVLKQVGEFLFKGALKLVHGEELITILKDAGDAIYSVYKDPVAFVGYLVEALKKGFNKFSAKFLDHLQAGVLEWLFGKIGKVAVPKKITFGSLFNLVLEVLGLTYQSVRPQLAKALGGMDNLAYVEKTVSIISIFFKDGFGAAWEEIVKQAGDLLDSLISAAKDWAVTAVVTAAVKELVKLFNPAGAVITAVQAIYSALKVIIQKAQELAQLIKAISSSISKIAAGQTDDAASYIEDVMARTIPIMIGFLADYLGLGNVADKIHEILLSVKAKIKAGIDKVIDNLAVLGRGALAKVKQVVKSTIQWWKERKKFNVGNVTHEIYLQGPRDHPEVIVESAPTPLERYLVEVKATEAEKAEIFALVKKLKWTTEDEMKDAAAANASGDGPSVFDQIVEKIGNLKSANKPVVAPPLFVKPQQTNSFGGGKQADVFLSLIQPLGTEPEDSSPHIREDLGEDLIKQKSYIRGHLLSQKLGGLGKWENMMPITNSANQTMERRIERLINKATGTGGVLVHYVVEAEYDESIKDSPITPQRAEQRLKRLRWKSNPATFENNQWKDTTVIPKDKDGKEIPGVANQDELDPTQTKATPLP